MKGANSMSSFSSFLDPAILFFFLGTLAGTLKSNLEIPPQISRFLSLYLLMSLGLKGGFALADSGLGGDVATSLACAVALAVVLPLLGYRLLKRFASPFDAAALAAAYGSVSAVTFIAATQFLETRSIPFGGHMAAAMALMESPAIIMAVVTANSLRHAQSGAVNGNGAMALTVSSPSHTGFGKILHESLTDGAQMLLLGALAIGYLTGDAGKAAMQPFSGDLFKGILAFFLLDMGLVAARSMAGLKQASPWLLSYALLAPMVHAGAALLLCVAFGISPGDGALLMALAASASYIAVPAALRYAIPEANLSLLIGMSLGLTFPFNILVGIPAYTHIASRVLT